MRTYSLDIIQKSLTAPLPTSLTELADLWDEDGFKYAFGRSYGELLATVGDTVLETPKAVKKYLEDTPQAREDIASAKRYTATADVMQGLMSVSALEQCDIDAVLPVVEQIEASYRALGEEKVPPFTIYGWMTIIAMINTDEPKFELFHSSALSAEGRRVRARRGA